MLKRTLDMAFAKGMRVIIDAHDYGGMPDPRTSPLQYLTVGAH